jgi:hypothetical protein
MPSDPKGDSWSRSPVEAAKGRQRAVGAGSCIQVGKACGEPNHGLNELVAIQQVR